MLCAVQGVVSRQPGEGERGSGCREAEDPVEREDPDAAYT
jgi:hypothetical protein